MSKPTTMIGPRGEARVDPAAVKRITPFVRPRMDPDQLPPDYFALLSLTFGVVGLMVKVGLRCMNCRYNYILAVLPQSV